MTFLDSVVLAVVEGVTEFLPVSSTAHMILTAYILGISQSSFVKSFEIIIQLGAILAVVAVYLGKFTDRKILLLSLIGFLPSAVAGLLLYPYIRSFFDNRQLLIVMLFAGGLVMIIIEMMDKNLKKPLNNLSAITLKKAAAIGLFQTISMVPGVSRAAATIIGGRFLGLDRKTAAEFSFILAVPTMAAASGLDIMKNGWTFTANEFLLLLTGFSVSFLVALAVIRFFLYFLHRHSFMVFGFYRIILATGFFLLFLR